MATLDVRHLTVRYAVAGGSKCALSDVNLRLQGDDFLVALGASGCGITNTRNGFLHIGLCLPYATHLNQTHFHFRHS